MYVPRDKSFVFCLRRTAAGIAPEGRSVRYAAISLIGLAAAEPQAVPQVLQGDSLQGACEQLCRDVAESSGLGDVALALWAACAVGYPAREQLWARLAHLESTTAMPPVVELAWALAASCMDHELDTNGLSARIAQRLLASYSERSGAFGHVVGATGLRSHVACFADMVYPIHALSHYSKLSGDRRALDVAARCAQLICERQGPAGQWWWHYDQRTGDVIEGYPVYAIHQDAMGPMALFALQAAGGPDYSTAIAKGLDWLWHAPEIGASLIDEEADLIWRKVARREPGKLSRYVQAASSRASPRLRMPGLDALLPPRSVDYEDRPYHLGWLLYAWPQWRQIQWDEVHG